MNIKLSELVKDNKVYFDSYRQGFFYYNIYYTSNTEDEYLLPTTFQFPIPQDDIGNATLEAKMKAIYTMRWIKRAQEEGTFIKLK